MSGREPSPGSTTACARARWKAPKRDLHNASGPVKPLGNTKPNGAPMTVFGYTRVSTAEQAADDRTSLATQRRKIAAAAELAGLAIDEIVEEAGVSGSKPLAERPSGGPLLARL